MESKMEEDLLGKEWRNSKGQLHRENDLPAVEYNDNHRCWCINDKLHREIGPAVITSIGLEHWYLNGIKYYPETMPIKLYIEYLKWEYRKKNGI